MAISPTRLRRWTRLEYDRLIEAGLFRPGERLELLAGHLVVREPQGSLHATAVGLVEDVLRDCFGAGWVVRVQMPIALDVESEPEPDVAVVPGARRDYELAHPAQPVLLVEVSESSLDDDRGDKASLYARAGVPDYWIVNLISRSLEVRRAPVPSATAPLGWSYGDVTVLELGASVSPLARPEARIPVADLFPRAGYSR
jgi:Uma2 family endonuclease